MLPDPVLQAIAVNLAVVPADMTKRPKVPWKSWTETHQTPDEAHALGHGSLWAVITGDLYGFVVLDFDGPEGLETMRSLGYEPHVKTASGAHVYVQHPGHPVKSSAKKFPQYPGLDIKGERSLAYFSGRSKKGSYTPVAWPPVPDTLPPELQDELFPHPQETATPAPIGSFDGPGHGEPEALRYLERACQDIDRAQSGSSNSELNKAGFSVGGLVASGQLDGDWAYERLLGAALNRGAGDPQTVLRASMEAGSGKPWKFEFEEAWVPAVAYKMFRTAASPEPVPFPIDVLPSPLAEFVRQGSTSVSCPPDYLGAGLLPVLGIGIGGYVDLRVTETWRESAQVYTTLVGPPGSRKSPAIDLLMAPVEKAEGRLEEIAKDAMDEGQDWQEIEPPQLVVDDATIEALFGVLERNERGIILSSDELTGWVSGMGQYKGGLGRDRQHWLSIWSRRPIKVSRVKAKNRTIRRPFVTVLGGIQPEPLEALLHGKDDGLLPRLLMARGEFVIPRLRRGAMDPALISGYDNLWNQLRDQGSVEQTVEFTASGFDAFETWANIHYETLSKVPPELAGAWAKLDGQFCRIALILARVLGSEVTEDIVERTAALIRYFQGQAAGLLQGSSSGSPWEKENAARMKTLARFLQANPGASKAELMTIGPWAMDSRTLDRLLEPLTEMGVWNG